MATIRCSVQSCHFYEEGDFCGADEIYVKNRLRSDRDDDFGRRQDMEAGELGKQDRDRSERNRFAKTSSETCCETFRYKAGKV